MLVVFYLNGTQMYKFRKAIKISSLSKFRAILILLFYHLTFLKHRLCAILDISTIGKILSPIGVQYTIIDNCLSQSEIRMAGKITLFKFLKYMVKHIELNPEWILTELPQSIYADGNGVISVDTDSSTDAKWIKLALKTLCIPFEENEFGDEDLMFIDIEFNIEDLKQDCPTLYRILKDVDTKNKIYKHTNLN